MSMISSKSKVHCGIAVRFVSGASRTSQYCTLFVAFSLAWGDLRCVGYYNKLTQKQKEVKAPAVCPEAFVADSGHQIRCKQVCRTRIDDAIADCAEVRGDGAL